MYEYEISNFISKFGNISEKKPLLEEQDHSSYLSETKNHFYLVNKGLGMLLSEVCTLDGSISLYELSEHCKFFGQKFVRCR